jgi:hypothetical protein
MSQKRALEKWKRQIVIIVLQSMYKSLIIKMTIEVENTEINNDLINE